MAESEGSIAALEAYIELFPIGDGIEIDPASGEDRSRLIEGFRALGYDVVEGVDGWKFLVRVRGAAPSGAQTL